jgi:salicylate hydroxylase/6-hydroxynicotinate 3-monooxygenase
LAVIGAGIEVLFDLLSGPEAETKYGAPYLLAHRGELHAALASAVPNRRDLRPG